MLNRCNTATLVSLLIFRGGIFTATLVVIPAAVFTAALYCRISAYND